MAKIFSMILKNKIAFVHQIFICIKMNANQFNYIVNKNVPNVQKMPLNVFLALKKQQKPIIHHFVNNVL
jgi:hypothetical protein